MDNTTDIKPEFLKEQEKIIKSIPKKGNAFNSFKTNKKLSQGVSVLCKTEQKKWEDLTTKEPSKNLFVIHFGNGGEEDFNGVMKHIEKFGKADLHIFPGLPYGFIEFENIEQAENLMKSTTVLTGEFTSNFAEVEFAKRSRTVFYFYTNLQVNQLQRQKDTDIPDAKLKVEIPGMELIENFVTPEEEQTLITEIDKNKWATLAHRRVQHYGYEFIYGANKVDKNKYMGPLPDFCPGVLDRINDISKKYNNGQPFDQMTINEYNPGDGIPPHVDTHETFEDCFVALSLGSGIVMTFKNDKGEQKHLFVPPRALVVFNGEARYAWYHMIATRKLDRVEGKLFFRRRRISLTVRRVRHTVCKCQWPAYCDSQNGGTLPAFMMIKKKGKVAANGEDESGEADAEEIKVQDVEGNKQETKLSEWEKKYVYQTYEKIAPHFSSTRYKPWPKIEKFLNELPPGSIVADVGCGNGKYLGVNQENLYTLGSDRSQNLIEICKTRDFNFQVFSADGLKLPFRNACVDCAISIAVIHHFSNKQLRIQAIRELARITRKDGKILIYVWALEQEGRKFTNQDLLVPWNLQFKYEDEGKLNEILGEKSQASEDTGEQITEVKEEEKKSDEAQGDGVGEIAVDEEKKTLVYKRYYHVFKYGELEELIKEVPEVEILESYYDHANWCVILKKKT